MDGMHAKPKDHLWVLAVIAVAVLAEVWASWVGIGAMSGFPRIERIPTDWVLAVAVEAYWGYALYAWLAAAPGPRSRAMAMWSCAVVFALSLVSQVSYHELTAPAHATAGKRFITGFASALPVIILALIAVLIHLRHTDRAEAADAERAQRAAEVEAQRAAAAADERTALRAELEDARAAVEPLRADLETAQRELARVTAKAGSLEQKLAALKPKRTRAKAPNSGRRKAPNSAPEGAPNSAGETTIPRDLNARTQALGLYLANPNISGRELGESVGRGERWGQLRKNEFAAAAPADPQARSES